MMHKHWFKIDTSEFEDEEALKQKVTNVGLQYIKDNGLENVKANVDFFDQDGTNVRDNKVTVVITFTEKCTTA